MTRNSKIALGVIFAVLFVDQAFKIYVKTHFELGEEVRVFGDWFRLHFVENNGMAFGMQLSGNSWGKVALSVFRLCAVAVIGYYLVRICRKGLESAGYVACVSLVLAGAVGNIIDSVFYGVIFDSSYGQVATLFPEGGGYGNLLHGKVVDMLFFPLFDGRFPDWMPLCGGNYFLFFSPVFNIADSAICVGIALLLLCHRAAMSRIFADAD
ncbi:MAG: lipoprotein signal peptidase [Marinilabiliaceae bacterium]